MVSWVVIRRWLNHFGPMIAVDLLKRRPKPNSEVYLKIDGRLVNLWRTVDSEGACHADSAVLGALIGSHQGRIIHRLMEIGVASPQV